MAQIDDVPEAVTGAGQEFDYPDPPRLTTVELVNAPLDPDHLNIGVDRAVYDAFIDAEIVANRAMVLTGVNLQDPAHDLDVEIEYETASMFYNYGRVTIGGRRWYVFYSPRYKNKTVTTLIADVDEVPSYDWSLGYSLVERGHVAVAASSGGDVSYCLEPEAYSPGELIGYAAYQADPLGTPAVLVISTTDLTADPFVTVDADTASTATDQITDTQATGTIDAPQPVGGPQPFTYAIGNGTYDDHFYYPYADSAGLSPGNTMYRPFVTGASPSSIDGVAAEGGAFVYSSVAQYVEHMALIAHTPWIADGISRAVLIPGGSGGSGSGDPLTPWDHVESTAAGRPTYHSTYSTAQGFDDTVASDWTAGLPAQYGAWTKLRTGPFSGVQVGDRQGGALDFDPQSITGLGALTLHFEGAYHPQADVVAWLSGALGLAAPNNPLSIAVGVELAHYAVGRDEAYADGAAGIAAERSQSIVDMLLATQNANVDTTFTRSSAFTATQYAVAEAV